MSDRWEKRKHSAETKSIIKKAKQDMLAWVEDLGRVPSSQETSAWQAGYISGINRGSENKNK